MMMMMMMMTMTTATATVTATMMMTMMMTMLLMKMKMQKKKKKKKKINTQMTMKLTNPYLPSNHGPKKIEPWPARGEGEGRYNIESFKEFEGPAACLFLSKATATAASTS